MKDASKLTESELRHFTGTENWYRHPLNRKVFFSDGAKHVADHGGAYWLLDIIACAQRYDKRVAATRFQVWKLSVGPGRKGLVICENGNRKLVCRQCLEFTDFPIPEIMLWFANGVIYLPSEH
jgi:hypothetical protein